MDEDLLNRDQFVVSFMKRLAGLRTGQSNSRVIAVVGPWGSGKSWILDRVRPDLGGVAQGFNPWLFSDELSLYRGFASLLLERIKDKKARKRFAAALDYLGPSLKGGGFDISGSVAKASEKLQGLRTPEEIQERLQTLVQEDLQESYILIDDLDRLTPSELLMFFKLIRLVGDLPRTNYVLAYDENTLLHLLSQTEIAHGSIRRARLYLEKIIEFKALVPPLSHDLKSSLISAPLLEFGRRIHPHFGEQEQQTLSWEVESRLFEQQWTLRSIDRFLDTVRSMPEPMYGELNYIDWVLICYLRVVEPHALEVILNQQYSLTGQSLSLAFDDGQARLNARRTAQALVLEADSEAHADSVLGIVDYLFPRFAHLRSEAQRSYSDDQSEREQRVSHRRYFHKYFAYDIPTDEVSDSEIESLLAALEVESSGELLHDEELRKRFALAPHESLKAIGRRWRRSSVPPATLFAFLTIEWGSEALNYRSGALGLSGRSELRVLAMDVLTAFDTQDLERLSSQVAPFLPASSLLSSLLVSGRNPIGSRELLKWYTEQRAAHTDTLSSRLKNASSIKPGEASADDARALIGLSSESFSSIAIVKLDAEEWTAEEVVLFGLQYHSLGGELVSNVTIADFYSGNERLAMLLQQGATGQYPAEWVDMGAFRAALSTLQHPSMDVASFVLNNWDQFVSAED